MPPLLSGIDETTQVEQASYDSCEPFFSMKHLIIFLDYNRSRSENPVYRIFAPHTASIKDTALFFLPGRLEERDLLRQTNELRHKEGDVDITFHICSHEADDPGGEHVISAMRLVRKLFFPADALSYPIFIYSQIEEVKYCNPAHKRRLWNYLSALNKAAIKYYDCTLTNGIYLYHDSTETTLANYLYYTIRSGVPAKALSPAAEESAPKQWAAVFGSMNVCGLSYPEDEIRRYLHFYHLQTVLRCSQPACNPIDMRECVRLAEELARNIPLETERIGLQEDAFLNLSEEKSSRWMPVKKFWTEEIEKAFEGLADIPRQEWLNKVHKNTTLLYQNRFRQVGVEYFFKLQENKTEEYCRTLLAIITEKFDSQIQDNPFTPEAFKAVINALINLLQQRLLEIRQQADKLGKQLAAPTKELEILKSAWGKLTILNRMMGKDKQILERYKQSLEAVYIARTRLAGCRFAIKLLNELIPHTAALKDRCDKLEEKLNKALARIETAATENNPVDRFGIFNSGLLSETEAAMAQDRRRILADYSEILKNVSASQPVTDGNELPGRLFQLFKEQTDEYLDSAIKTGALPPILNIDIVDRIRRIYGDRGGIKAFMQELKKRIPILLETKLAADTLPTLSSRPEEETGGGYTKKFLLVSPSAEQEWTDETFCLDSLNTIGLIHLCYGLDLTQLEGFSGQRVTFEPSIF